MDFYQIMEESAKGNVLKIYPDFRVCRSKDLMIRGKAFYAIWDEERGLWSTDEYDVQRFMDKELEERRIERAKTFDGRIEVKRMIHFSSNMLRNYKSFVREMADNAHPLDNHIVFSNTQTRKTDYVSHRLPYPLEEGPIPAYEELMSTLYKPAERAKLEWAIGAIISGDSRNIQKFIVLYGEAGSGKSTVLNIIQKMFEGYYTTFEAKALTSSSNAFSTEAFKSNPLIAIQHDGDLSRIEDNTKLNSLVSHEEMYMNEKYKPSYTARSNAFLFMGTNKPVKITDAKSGIIRRLIDVKPSGNKIPPKRYHNLMVQIDFELGGIAHHCLHVYNSMGKNYYSKYKPLDMIFQTDVFFNFIEENYHVFNEQDGVSLSQAYEMYKNYCEDSLVEYKLSKYKFREELKSYFNEFKEVKWINDKQVRSYYCGFLADKFKMADLKKDDAPPCSLVLDSTESILDNILADCPAQYATVKETPIKKWDEVNTKLSDLDTKKIHYILPPSNHIVIDFDLKDSKGEKSMELNLDAASKWPTTYTEFSKGGSGIHLHYIYDGDISRLSRIHSEGIEIKVFTGNSSLRRKLSKCNNSPILTINSGLPLKGETMINFDAVKSEKALRNLIEKNLRKEIHPGTKPSMDFIHKILEDAYTSGMKYSVVDLRPKILTFANNSSNQSDYCVKLVNKMKFASEEISDNSESYNSDDLIFYDVEVFPNLFVLVWKKEGGTPVKMINPTAEQIGDLMRFKLVGFNCRRYDNHILYARYIGYDNQRLYELSQRIVNGSSNCMFGEAYGISYTDVYDFASAGNKKGLKKFEIELGIHHQELGLPWDQPVAEEMWATVADYCVNDVVATEAVFKHLAGDWAARQILAALSGLTVNDTTNSHSTKIVFGNEKNPQSEFKYTDLSEMFPGYKFENGKSIYRGEEVGEGGYVYAEPGMYGNVALLDVASMHPTSIEELNLFGPYTSVFSDIKNGRVFIKHKNYGSAKIILDGKLAPFIEEIENGTASYSSGDLSNALKTVINSVYGLTSAKFDNKFRDKRNIDNIVAKRGALFMIDLKHAVQEMGFKVAHIKTDSIKIPDATPEVIDFIMDFGSKYGYTFEHEDTYQRMCLVNDAVYIAKTGKGEWSATGAQFAQPYVFKTLFSKESIVFEDVCETKSVTTSIYIDMNENLSEGEHDYHFVGKVGSFCPILPGRGGGVLLREKDGKYYAVGGTKGYRWLEAEMVKALHKEDDIDHSYYTALCDSAIDNMSKYGDVEWMYSTDVVIDDMPPWCDKCNKEACKDCTGNCTGKCNHN